MNMNAISVWSDERGAWLVSVTDGERVNFYEVAACDEWVIPLAEMLFNGLDVKTILHVLDADDWYCEECEQSEMSFEQWKTMRKAFEAAQ